MSVDAQALKPEKVLSAVNALFGMYSDWKPGKRKQKASTKLMPRQRNHQDRRCNLAQAL